MSEGNMEFKGSAAPWRINSTDYHDYGLIDADGEEIMLLKADCEKDDHNASLIGAAPELLEALQRLVEMHDNPERLYTVETKNRSMGKARAAISKALGEE